MPGFFDASSTTGLTGFAVAAVLYIASYLTFVRTLRYTRNWIRPRALSIVVPAGFISALVACVSLSSGGFDAMLAVAAVAFVGILFYLIAAPAIVFRPASRLTELLARHGDYAGLSMLVPALIAAYTFPNAGFYGLLAAAMTIELLWYLRRGWARRKQRLLPIQGDDLAVLKVQAKGDLVRFAKQHGINELVLSGDTVAWKGCNKNTSPCPFNLYVNRLGLNTAPCCREHMQSLVHSVSGWLEEIGVDYWLEGGTLLGAVRDNGELLPWEDDVDVSVVMEDDSSWKALVAGVTACAARDGYCIDIFEPGGFIAVSYATPRAVPLRWENYRLRGEVRLDLTTYWPTISEGKHVLRRSSLKGDMPAIEGGGFGVARNLVLPTSTISLLGRDCACPRLPEDYLRVLYGDFRQVAYSYVDAGPAAARSHIDTTAQTSPSAAKPH